MEKKKFLVYLLAIFLCLAFFALAFFSASGKFWQGYKTTGMALTSDEVSHITDGYYYLKTGRYFINPEHPPIIKDIAALPLLFLNPELPQIPEYLEHRNDQWDYGRKFLFESGNDPDQITFWSRLAIILFNTILLFLVFIFLKKLWKARAALLALFLLAFCQFFIAHGSLVTTDTIVSLFIVLSGSTFALFLKNFADKKRIYWLYFCLAIFFTACALLTKFSAVLVVVALFAAGLAYLLFSGRFQRIWKFIGLFILFCLALVLLIGLFYAPHVHNMDKQGLVYQIESNFPDNYPGFAKDALIWTTDHNSFLKGLAEYSVGMFMVRSRMEGAVQQIYFLGHVYGQEGAGFWYFPVLYFTKTSLPFLMLLVLTIIFVIWGVFRDKKITRFDLKSAGRCPLVVILALFGLGYLALSLTSRLQIGLRHILPVMVAIALLMAKKLGEWWQLSISKKWQKLKWQHVFVVLFLLIIISTLISYPYYLEYYNILVGGTESGYKISDDSNYDWAGQDMKRLANWVKENNIDKVYLHVFTNVPPEYYLDDRFSPYAIWREGKLPSGSILVVSANELMNTNYASDLSNERKYFQHLPYQIARVGMTMFVFRIP